MSSSRRDTASGRCEGAFFRDRRVFYGHEEILPGTTPPGLVSAANASHRPEAVSLREDDMIRLVWVLTLSNMSFLRHDTFARIAFAWHI